MSIAIALKALLSFQHIRWLTSNPLTPIKGFDSCRGSVNLIVGGETLAGAFRQFEEGFERVSTLKCFSFLMARLQTSSKDK